MKNKHNVSELNQKTPNIAGRGRRKAIVSAIAGGIMLIGCGNQQDTLPEDRGADAARAAIERVLPGMGNPEENGHALDIERTIEKAAPLFLQSTFDRVKSIEGRGSLTSTPKPSEYILQFNDASAETVKGAYAGQWKTVTLTTPAEGAKPGELSTNDASPNSTIESLSILYDPQTGQPKVMDFRVEGGLLSPDPEDEQGYANYVTGVSIDLLKGEEILVREGDSLTRFAGGELQGTHIGKGPSEITQGFEAVERFLDRAAAFAQN